MSEPVRDAPRVDPAVRSIRIATTLNERLAAIYKAASDAHEAAEFELMIGEAQQIYPEMWRHLDEARGVLAARGCDVGPYDAIRGTERPGQLAVDNIQSSEGINPLALAFGSIEFFKLKTASLNHEGQAKARDACNALMAAMPDVDWKALAREEDAQIAAAGAIRTGMWFQYAIYAGLAVFLLWIVSKAL